jgi:hypothetical protein
MTLVSLSLSLIVEAPRILGKAAQVAVDTTIFGREVALTDHNLVWIKVAGVLLVVAFTLMVQYRQVYRPFVKFEELRRAAFDQVFAPQLDKLRRSVSSDLRFNIMRRTTYLKFTRHIQIGRLRHIYHYGYRHDDRTKSLRLWYVRIFAFEYAEGIAGATFLTEQPTISDLRDPRPSNTRLRGRKLQLTRNTKLIISFPVFQWAGDRYTSVGTINVDISDETVATAMFAESPFKRLEKLAQYVQDCAEYVSLWL